MCFGGPSTSSFFCSGVRMSTDVEFICQTRHLFSTPLFEASVQLVEMLFPGSLDTSFFLNACQWKPGYPTRFRAVLAVFARNNAAWAVPMHNCPMSRRNSTKGLAGEIPMFLGEQ